MFDSLTDRLQGIFTKLKGRGRLSEADVDVALREVRMALLEADVNYKVVKEFVGKLRARAVGSEVLESLTPAQQVIKIVHEELVGLLGTTESRLPMASQPPTVIMLVGLQGSGKTTATAKLAHHLRRQGKQPLMIAADIHRPAAVEQLKALGAENGLPVFSGAGAAEEIAAAGIKEAVNQGNDVVLVDTAGRLHIDDEMMTEAVNVRTTAKPHQILLVVDAMTGQDAVNVAQAFQEKLEFDGLILTKMDGDARGGAALSIRSVTGRPVKFLSLGEKVDSIEPFYPDRLASRILGMGDVLTLIEKAESVSSEKDAKLLAEKLKRQEFDLSDFLGQMKQLRNMGPIGQVMKMLPGMSGMPAIKDNQIGEEDLVRIQAIIESMTPAERSEPSIISGSRRERIAKGSGTTVTQVNQLLKQFQQTKKLIKNLTQMGGKRARKGLPFF
jgi:signal recognition particle subunit SRP54